MPKPRPIEERFWEKVAQTDGCWLWTGATINGYGVLGLGAPEKGNVRATRLVWEWRHGPIPEGHYVCHHCDVPACVRPDHLFLATNSENLRDAVYKGRHKLVKLSGQDIRELFDAAPYYAFWGGQAILAQAFGVSRQMLRLILADHNRYTPRK